MDHPHFDTITSYAGCFNDAAYWRTYVEEICRRHAFTPPLQVEAGLAGTFPTFIVDGRYVVKLFGEQFDGIHRFEVEHAVYKLLHGAPELAVPSLITAGRLFPDAAQWSWPYLVSSAIPGTSLGEVRASVSTADQRAVARWVGRQVRALYELRLPESGVLAATWDHFDTFLNQRRSTCAEQHRSWATLPRPLLEQIDSYVLPADRLIDRSAAPRLLHSDLNEDHILGTFDGPHWKPGGIIDFGDVVVGDPIYDLVALHVGLTHCDKQLLRFFLEASGTGLERQPEFAQRAMSATLLFEFNVLEQVFADHPSARNLASLAELAAWMWDLEQLG